MYESYHEIFEQHGSLRKTFDMVLDRKEEIKAFFDSQDYEEVIFIACGSSYWLSLSSHMTFAEKTGKRAFAVKAGDVVMNPGYYRKAFRKPLIITPSRSGTTSEVLKAIEILKEAYDGIRVLAAVVYPESPLEKLADLTLSLLWANEASVCQTRSFSNLYLCMVLVAAIAGDDPHLVSGMKSYIGTAQSLLANMKVKVDALVRAFGDCNYLVAIGSGKQYGVAVEGAYIGIEMAAFPASYFGVLELRHGPIVRLDGQSLVAVISNGEAREYEEEIAAESRRKGARVLAVIGNGDFSEADYVFDMDGVYPPEAVALYGIAVLQGFAYFKAVQLGIDPDHPSGLTPYICI